MILSDLSLDYKSPQEDSLFQHDENAKGKISTQYAQDTFNTLRPDASSMSVSMRDARSRR